MTDEPHNPDEMDLWRSFQAAGRPHERCPDPLELASYVDGRLTGAPRERLAAHLALCPACRQAVAETREILAGPAVLPPEGWVRRAKSLAQPRQPAAWPALVRWAASAAAVVAVSLAGFAGGSATYRNRQTAEANLLQVVSFGLTDSDLDTSAALGWLDSGAAGQTGGAQ